MIPDDPGQSRPFPANSDYMGTPAYKLHAFRAFSAPAKTIEPLIYTKTARQSPQVDNMIVVSKPASQNCMSALNQPLQHCSQPCLEKALREP